MGITWRDSGIEIRGNTVSGTGCSAIYGSSAVDEIRIEGNTFRCCIPGCPEPDTAHMHESAAREFARNAKSGSMWIGRVLPDPPGYW